MNGPDHDPEFEDFLKRRSPMHRRLSDFDHAEPPAELDRLVLDRAREAIQAPRQPPVYRATRWAMPVGLAATILMAFAFVLHVGRHEFAADRSTEAPVAASAQTDSAPTIASSAQEAASLPEASTDVPEMLAKQEARSANESARQSARDPEMMADDAASLARGSAASSNVHSEPSGALTAQSDADTGSSYAEADVAAAASERPLSDRAFAASSPSVVTAAAAAPPVEHTSHADPEAWLREIRRLRDEGRAAEADRELDAFRRAFPRHPGQSLAKQPTN